SADRTEKVPAPRRPTTRRALPAAMRWHGGQSRLPCADVLLRHRASADGARPCDRLWAMIARLRPCARRVTIPIHDEARLAIEHAGPVDRHGRTARSDRAPPGGF